MKPRRRGGSRQKPWCVDCDPPPAGKVKITVLHPTEDKEKIVYRAVYQIWQKRWSVTEGKIVRRKQSLRFTLGNKAQVYQPDAAITVTEAQWHRLRS